MGLKDVTRSAILDMYAKHGIASVRPKAELLIKQCESSKFSAQQRTEVKGELSEVVLECYLANLQKRVTPSILSKGLCIHNPLNGLTTELDLTFFTPGCIYMFECKSYTGEKTLTDKCFLKGRFTEKDVQGQSVHHMKVLYTYLQRYLINQDVKGRPPFKLVLFELSTNECKDLREPTWKEAIPLVTLDTVQPWLLSEFSKETKVNWDIRGMSPLLSKLDSTSAKLFAQHVARLS